MVLTWNNELILQIKVIFDYFYGKHVCLGNLGPFETKGCYLSFVIITIIAIIIFTAHSFPLTKQLKNFDKLMALFKKYKQACNDREFICTSTQRFIADLKWH